MVASGEELEKRAHDWDPEPQLNEAKQNKSQQSKLGINEVRGKPRETIWDESDGKLGQIKQRGQVRWELKIDYWIW